MSDTRVIHELTRHRSVGWVSHTATYHCTCGQLIGHAAGSSRPVPGDITALDWWTAEHIADALDKLDIANTFPLTATPEEIHAAVDVLRDLGVTDQEWEYTDFEAEHSSGFRFIPADGYMPDELRPDIGVDY